MTHEQCRDCKWGDACDDVGRCIDDAVKERDKIGLRIHAALKANDEKARLEVTAAHLDTDQPMTFGTLPLPEGKCTVRVDAAHGIDRHVDSVFMMRESGLELLAIVPPSPDLTPHHLAMIAAAKRLWDATAAFREATGGVWPARWIQISSGGLDALEADMGTFGVCITARFVEVCVDDQPDREWPMPPFAPAAPVDLAEALASLDGAPGIPEALDRARERRAAAKRILADPMDPKDVRGRW